MHIVTEVSHACPRRTTSASSCRMGPEQGVPPAAQPENRLRDSCHSAQAAPCQEEDEKEEGGGGVHGQPAAQGGSARRGGGETGGVRWGGGAGAEGGGADAGAAVERALREWAVRMEEMERACGARLAEVVRDSVSGLLSKHVEEVVAVAVAQVVHASWGALHACSSREMYMHICACIYM